MRAEAKKTVVEFTERMGVIFEAEGLPRIGGRIFGYLVMLGGPFTLAELAENLQVSRGSVSTNTRMLEQLGVIERVGKSGDRQSYYELAPDPYQRLLRGSIARMERAQQAVTRARENLPAEVEGASRRLKDLAKFYQTTIDSFEQALA